MRLLISTTRARKFVVAASQADRAKGAEGVARYSSYSRAKIVCIFLIAASISLRSSIHGNLYPASCNTLCAKRFSGSSCGFGSRLSGLPLPGRSSNCPLRIASSIIYRANQSRQTSRLLVNFGRRITTHSPQERQRPHDFYLDTRHSKNQNGDHKSQDNLRDLKAHMPIPRHHPDRVRRTQ